MLAAPAWHALHSVIKFSKHKELAVRVDDARKESKFGVKEMMLGSENEQRRVMLNLRLGLDPIQIATRSLKLSPPPRTGIKSRYYRENQLTTSEILA